MTSRHIISLLVVAALAVGVGIFSYVTLLQHEKPKPPELVAGETVDAALLDDASSLDVTSSDRQEIFDVIVKKDPYLVDKNGQILFSITKTVQPIRGWYVVTMKFNGSEDGPYKVILSRTTRSDRELIIIDGPDKSFSENLEIPKEVREATLA